MTRKTSLYRAGARAAAATLLALAAVAAGTEPLRTVWSGRSDPPSQRTASAACDRLGDPLPPGALARLGTARLRAPDASVAVRADGQRIVTLGPDLVVRQFDARTGASRGTRPLRRGRGTPIGLAPGGSLGLTTAVDPTNPSEEWLHLWDTNSGEQVDTLALAPFSLEWAAAAPDGKVVALTDSGGRVRLWYPNSPKTRQLWAPTEEARTNSHLTIVARSPDGKRVAACCIDRALRCWDVESGKLLWQAKQAVDSFVVLFSPDGQTIVAQDARKGVHLRTFDAATGKPIGEAPALPADAVCALGFSPDGRLLALQTGNEGAVLWEPATGKVVSRVPGPIHRRGDDGCVRPTVPPTNFAFTPDGSGFVYRSDIVQRWDVATGKPAFDPAAVAGHSQAVTRLLFTPDGRRLVSSSQADHTARIWDVAGGQLLHTIPKGSCSPDLTPDGRHLAVVPFAIRRVDDKPPPSNSALRVPAEIVHRVQHTDLAEDEFHAPLQVWDVATGQLVRRLALPGDKTVTVPGDDRGIVHVTADGKKVLLLTPADRGVQNRSLLSAWAVADGACVTHRALPGAVASVVTPDGDSVLSLERDGSVRLVSLQSDRPHLEFQFDRARVEFHIPADPTGTVQMLMECALALAPDRRLMALRVRYPQGGDEKGASPIRLGSMATGHEVTRLPAEGPALLAFSGDGGLLAVAGRDAVRLWETASGKEVGAIPLGDAAATTPNRLSVGALAFSPDGRTLATGQADGTILLWDATLQAGAAAGPWSPGRAEALWADLASPDARRAYAARWQLANNPQEAVAFLKSQLRPADAAAAEIRAAIANLDSDTFARREAAEQRLRELSDRAEETLREALTRDLTPECRRRIEAVLGAVDPAGLVSGEPLREVRAVLALEAIGSPDALELLHRLTRGTDSARLTQVAREALARLKKR